MQRKIGTCYDCGKVKPIHAHGSCAWCYTKNSRNRWDDDATEAELNRMIEKMRPTMPDSEDDPHQQKPPRKFGLDRPCEKSPHGLKCPLLPLLLDESILFTVALMKADKWLRSEECEVLMPAKLKATTDDRGDTICLTVNSREQHLELWFDSVPGKRVAPNRIVQRKKIWKAHGSRRVLAGSH
jgi:hypothetical protein